MFFYRFRDNDRWQKMSKGCFAQRYLFVNQTMPVKVSFILCDGHSIYPMRSTESTFMCKTLKMDFELRIYRLSLRHNF